MRPEETLNEYRAISSSWKWMLKIVVTALALYFVLRTLDWGELQGAFTGVHWGWFLVSMVCILGLSFPNALRWAVLIPIPGVRFHKYLYYVFVGHFLNLSSPSAALAEGVRAYAFGRRYGDLRKNFVATLFARAVGLCVLAAVAALALLVSGEDIAALPLWGGVALPSGMVWFGVAMFVAASGAGVFVARRRLASIRGDLMGFMRARVLVRVVLISILIQAIMVLSVYALFRSLLWPLSIWQAALIPAMVQIILLLPISFGGVGVREYLSILLYGQLAGVPSSIVLASSVLAYVPMLLQAGFGGAWMVFRRDGGHGKAEGEASRDSGNSERR